MLITHNNQSPCKGDSDPCDPALTGPEEREEEENAEDEAGDLGRVGVESLQVVSCNVWLWGHRGVDESLPDSHMR